MIPDRPVANIFKQDIQHQGLRSPNNATVANKPKAVQGCWALLEKLDPQGMLVTEQLMAYVAGLVPIGRQPRELGFTEDEEKQAKGYSVLYSDVAGDNPDLDPGCATSVVFSVYQVVERAYALGRQDEAADAAKAAVRVSRPKPALLVDDLSETIPETFDELEDIDHHQLGGLEEVNEEDEDE